MISAAVMLVTMNSMSSHVLPMSSNVMGPVVATLAVEPSAMLINVFNPVSSMSNFLIVLALTIEADAPVSTIHRTFSPFRRPGNVIKFFDETDSAIIVNLGFVCSGNLSSLSRIWCIIFAWLSFGGHLCLGVHPSSLHLWHLCDLVCCLFVLSRYVWELG